MGGNVDMAGTSDGSMSSIVPRRRCLHNDTARVAHRRRVPPADGSTWDHHARTRGGGGWLRAPSIERWVPGVRAVRTYRRPWLRWDIVAGIVLAAILVPQGMAYAELAGLPAVTGLYTT